MDTTKMQPHEYDCLVRLLDAHQTIDLLKQHFENREDEQIADQIIDAKWPIESALIDFCHRMKECYEHGRRYVSESEVAK